MSAVRSGGAIRSNAATVEFRGVCKTFPGGVRAVDDVSLRVEAGTLLTLLGPSGCGKTTILRLIAGLETATSGEILIGDVDVTLLPATARDVSMVFQSYALFPHMTVAENVGYGLRFSSLPKDRVGERVDAGLALVGLEGYGARLPSELSGGQQQRVAVARALVLEPQVLLFDEPLSNLDARLRRRVREEIREIQSQLGLTVVYVTHDQEEALAVSDRIVVMNEAVVAQEGAPRELYEAPNTPFVADFIGDANVLDCEVAATSEGVAEVRLGAIALRLPDRGVPPGAAQLAVRPNRVRIEVRDAPNSVSGRVARATYVGRHLELTVDSAIGSVFAVLSDTGAGFAAGDDVAVSFAPDAPVLLPG